MIFCNLKNDKINTVNTNRHHRQSDELQNILSDEQTFDKLLETELEYYKNFDIAGRAKVINC